MPTVKVIIEKTVDCCDPCPYFHEEVDYSVCEDSFDDPNYDFFCQHADADNSGTDREQYNSKHGKFIDGSLTRFHLPCDIPSWCPFLKHKEE